MVPFVTLTFAPAATNILAISYLPHAVAYARGVQFSYLSSMFNFPDVKSSAIFLLLPFLICFHQLGVSVSHAQDNDSLSVKKHTPVRASGAGNAKSSAYLFVKRFSAVGAGFIISGQAKYIFLQIKI